MNKFRDNIDFFLNRSFGRKQSLVNACNKLESAIFSVLGKNNRYIVNSIPKSGTHFIEKILVNSGSLKKSGFFFSDIHHNRYPRDLSDYQSQINLLASEYFCGAHMPYSDTNRDIISSNNLKHILLIRNPADVLVSQYHHCLSRPSNRVHSIVSECNTFVEGIDVLFDGYQFSTTSDQIIPSLEPFIDYYDAYHQWLDPEKSAQVFRFENLLAHKKSTDKSSELNSLLTLIAGDNDSIDNNITNTIFEKSFGNSNTFRSGKVGGWRESVSLDDQQYIDNKLLPLCEKFGY